MDFRKLDRTSPSPPVRDSDDNDNVNDAVSRSAISIRDRSKSMNSFDSEILTQTKNDNLDLRVRALRKPNYFEMASNEETNKTKSPMNHSFSPRMEEHLSSSGISESGTRSYSRSSHSLTRSSRDQETTASARRSLDDYFDLPSSFQIDLGDLDKKYKYPNVNMSNNIENESVQDSLLFPRENTEHEYSALKVGCGYVYVSFQVTMLVTIN